MSIFLTGSYDALFAHYHHRSHCFSSKTRAEFDIIFINASCSISHWWTFFFFKSSRNCDTSQMKLPHQKINKDCFWYYGCTVHLWNKKERHHSHQPLQPLPCSSSASHEVPHHPGLLFTARVSLDLLGKADRPDRWIGWDTNNKVQSGPLSFPSCLKGWQCVWSNEQQSLLIESSDLFWWRLMLLGFDLNLRAKVFYGGINVP